MNNQSNLTVKEKQALCGLPQPTIRGGVLSKKKQEEILKNASSKCRWLYNLVLYEPKCVKVRLTKVPLKHTSFKPAQLIRHFSENEVRRAANRLWQIKRYYNV